MILKKNADHLKRKLAEDFPLRYTVILPEIRDWIRQLQIPAGEEDKLLHDLAQLNDNDAIKLLEDILNEDI